MAKKASKTSKPAKTQEKPQFTVEIVKVTKKPQKTTRTTKSTKIADEAPNTPKRRTRRSKVVETPLGTTVSSTRRPNSPTLLTRSGGAGEETKHFYPTAAHYNAARTAKFTKRPALPALPPDKWHKNRQKNISSDPVPQFEPLLTFDDAPESQNIPESTNSTHNSTPNSTKTPNLDEIDISNPVPRTGIDLSKSEHSIERILNVKWSRFIPHAPTKKQLAASMLAHVKELLYGGALGGGKSDWLAMEALRYCDLPGFSSIIFRRQLTDLKQPGSLIPRIANWLAPFAERGECKYNAEEHSWYFKTFYPNTDIPGPDARLQFGYIGEASVRDRYQSAEYQLVCFDELAQWPDDIDYLFMRTRIRKVVCPIHGKVDGVANYVSGCRFCDTLGSIPLRIRAATNPGPAWIKRRFGIIPDPSQFKSRHEALIAISEGQKVRWVGTVKHRPFIPSYLDDNPHLDAKDYKEMLREMSEEERSRLEDGNWEARKNARFKRRWQKFYRLICDQELLEPFPNTDFFMQTGTFQNTWRNAMYAKILQDRQGNDVLDDPRPLSSLEKIFTTVDPAVTVRQGPVDNQVRQKNSSAVLSTFGLTHNSDMLWLNMCKFRKEIPDLIDSVQRIHAMWEPRYFKIECNGVGIGLAQYAEAAGYPVRKNYKKHDKIENSISAQNIMRAGRIYFPINALWLEEAEDDIFSWTGLPTEEDDVVDTLCDGCNDMTYAVAHEISAPSVQKSRPFAVTQRSFGTGLIPQYGLHVGTNRIHRY